MAVSECFNLKGNVMKRYKVSVDGGEYREGTDALLPLAVRECVEILIDNGKYTGTVDIPGLCCHFSVCPDQYFPSDTIDNIHYIAAEIRSMAETVEGIDGTVFRQTIAILRSSASRMTAAAKRERNRNESLNGNRIELGNRDSELCPYHTMNESGYHHYLNSDCPVCQSSEASESVKDTIRRGQKLRDELNETTE